MKIERTKNAKRNMLFGTVLKIYQIIVPFLMRTAMIYFMGVQYLGLNSLFTSVLQVLNLAELGVGSAMVYSMYKPIAEDDTATICALMRLYRLYYRIIGGVIAIIGIILTPLIPYLIKSDLSTGLNIYVLYWINLAATVLSYWLFAYKNALFQAHQRVDITSKVSLITSTVQYTFQLFIILFVKNYYAYLLVTLFTQVLNNIARAVLAIKIYPDYSPKGEMDRVVVDEVNGKIRDLFTSKIGSVVVNSADTVVISAFLGLTVLAVYQNYYFIITSVIGFVDIIFQSCTAGIGNSIVMESKGKNFDDMKKFTFLIAWIAGFCTCCLLCLFQPFIEIWVGKELMLDFSMVVCFCIYYFIYEINRLLNIYKDAAGIWHEDRFRPLATSLVNLGLNLIFVQYIGLYGILLSTVLSTFFVGTPWLLHNLFTVLFEQSQIKEFLSRLVWYTFIVLISCIICNFICLFLNYSKVLTLVSHAIVVCIIPNVIFLVAYHRMAEFRQCLHLIDRMTNYKLHLETSFCVK